MTWFLVRLIMIAPINHLIEFFLGKGATTVMFTNYNFKSSLK
jgi:hypothetical protein